MKVPGASALGQLLTTVGREFRKRKCVQEVEGEATTQVFMVDGVECQMVLTIKVYPVATGNVVPIKRPA